MYFQLGTPPFNYGNHDLFHNTLPNLVGSRVESSPLALFCTDMFFDKTCINLDECRSSVDLENTISVVKFVLNFLSTGTKLLERDGLGRNYETGTLSLRRIL